jgi:hypothetical protein
MIRSSTRLLPLFIAALLAIPLSAGLPDEPIPHLVLKILRDSMDNVLGYEVHHEVEMVPYVATLSPDSMGRNACRRDGIRFLEVREGDGLPTFTGSDGSACTLAKFKPAILDPYEKLPPKEEPRGECPSCPGP